MWNQNPKIERFDSDCFTGTAYLGISVARENRLSSVENERYAKHNYVIYKEGE